MVVMEDNESCGSRGISDILPTSQAAIDRRERMKMEVFDEVISRLRQSDTIDADLPGFVDDLWAHFNRLPARVRLIVFRYALDVNVERAEDVLMHQRLLHSALDPNNRPVIQVRLVQVQPPTGNISADSTALDSLTTNEPDQASTRKSIHPPPAFGSSPNLEALALASTISHDEEEGGTSVPNNSRPLHEITFSTIDKPKLLFQLTALLAELGLNIQEAHAFSTTDGFSLDVFVVDGWPYEMRVGMFIHYKENGPELTTVAGMLHFLIIQEVDRLRIALEKEAAKIEDQSWPMQQSFSPEKENGQTGVRTVAIPTDGTDVWEINLQQLKFGHKIASGSYGDLYKGTYCSQEVAIKVLKPERLDSELEKEFAQEVFIMRKVRHKNVVQFIGACTKPPHLCIVTEFMPGGSVYDYLHKQKGVFKLPALLKVAIDICKGMNYLHQNNIIHRDLKAANLLMDEHEIPYEYMTPLQAAVGVVQKGLRPTIPKKTHPKMRELMERLWEKDPTLRPDFSEIIEQLQEIAKEVEEEEEEKKRSPTGGGGGIFAALRRSATHH
ncbi:hypothetical protein DY000_02009054 [Brassica cretica]|uniref:Protein kinase domain-containing protein n=1 Tax=Brassica cretica TaxID=69181 RepID=A0ABQ7CG29_BRACR|nr:hypothetical protein DY000_02009054 [Brassica cretica]